MAVLRKTALTVARPETESGVFGWRKQLAWSGEHLNGLLFFSGLAAA